MMRADVIEANGEVVETPERKREQWIEGSVPQLRHFWSGRCVTCANWSAADDGATGTCGHIVAPDTDGLITITSRDAAVTAPHFGCLLWAEIAPVVVRDDEGRAVMTNDPDGNDVPKLDGVDEADALIRSRTEKAIAVGLLDDVPDEDDTP